MREVAREKGHPPWLNVQKSQSLPPADGENRKEFGANGQQDPDAFL